MTSDRMASSLARPPALRIDLRVALAQPRVLGGIQSRVHAGEDREAPGGRKRQLAPGAEGGGVLFVGANDLSEDGHRSCYPGAGFPFPRRNHLRIVAITELAIPATLRRAARFHQIVRYPSRAPLDQLVERARALDTKKRHRWRFPAPPASRPGSRICRSTT